MLPSLASCTSRRRCWQTNFRAPCIWRSPAPNGEEDNNPFDSLAAIYLIAEEPASRVLVKLAGRVTLNESTLQATSTFTNAPQVPFEELKLDLFGGPRAALTTPPFCGAYQMSGTFTPWAGQPPLDASTSPSEFAIDSRPEGVGCPGSGQPFAPGFQAQASNPQAGGIHPVHAVDHPSGRRSGGALDHSAAAPRRCRAAFHRDALPRTPGRRTGRAQPRA